MLSKPKFSLKLVDKASGSAAGSNRAIGEIFTKDGGEKLVADVLEKAGVAEGEWRLVLLDRIHGSAGMPKFAAKRPAVNGVICKIKPGDNGSAAEAVVTPPHGGMSALKLHERLIALAMQEAEEKEPVVLPLPQAAVSPIAELLKKYRPKLQALLDAPKRLEELAGARGRVQKLADEYSAKLAELTGELDKIGEEEARLMNIDPEALALLLE